MSQIKNYYSALEERLREEGEIQLNEEEWEGLNRWLALVRPEHKPNISPVNGEETKTPKRFPQDFMDDDLI